MMNGLFRRVHGFTAVSAGWLLACSILFCPPHAGAGETDEKMKARAHLELGIDSRQQKYLSPCFEYEFPLKIATVFGQVIFIQRAGDQLRGTIDYWLNLGLKKTFSPVFSAEIRLNHFCRHLSSIGNPDILNLNEILARAWFRNRTARLGLGLGTYTGGNVDYQSLMVLNGGLDRILGTDLSIRGEVTFRDFREILYDAELCFALTQGTDIFIRNSKDYQFENTTYIGIRMKSSGKIQRYLDSLKLSTGFYPYFEAHKILAEGEFRMFFFKASRRRLIFSLDFTAPIIRDNGFWGDFYPENMVYHFRFEYEYQIRDLFLIWYSQYGLNLPLDTDRKFDSDLGTGIGIRNQPDFDLLNRKIRFEAAAGFNFDLDYDVNVKLGFNLLTTRWLESHCEWRFRLNDRRSVSSLRLFVELGGPISIRPFLRFDHTTIYDSRQPSDIRFLFGVGLFKWYDR